MWLPGGALESEMDVQAPVGFWELAEDAEAARKAEEERVKQNGRVLSTTSGELKGDREVVRELSRSVTRFGMPSRS
eukprot:14080277-Heterocapsa_arctica.AAC.1